MRCWCTVEISLKFRRNFDGMLYMIIHVIEISITFWWSVDNSLKFLWNFNSRFHMLSNIYINFTYIWVEQTYSTLLIHRSHFWVSDFKMSREKLICNGGLRGVVACKDSLPDSDCNLCLARPAAVKMLQLRLSLTHLFSETLTVR